MFSSTKILTVGVCSHFLIFYNLAGQFVWAPSSVVDPRPLHTHGALDAPPRHAALVCVRQAHTNFWIYLCDWFIVIFCFVQVGMTVYCIVLPMFNTDGCYYLFFVLRKDLSNWTYTHRYKAPHTVWMIAKVLRYPRRWIFSGHGSKRRLYWYIVIAKLTSQNDISKKWYSVYWNTDVGFRYGVRSFPGRITFLNHAHFLTLCQLEGRELRTLTHIFGEYRYTMSNDIPCIHM